MATKKKIEKKTDPKSSTKKVQAGRKAPASKTAAAPKEKKAKQPATGGPVKMGPRHPRGRVLATPSGSKEALAKALAPSLARADEDTDQLEARLKTASNAQLLRLQKVTEQVKAKWGSRDALIEAIGKTANKTKDKDFVAKLGRLSLPNLLDLAVSAERRARA